MQPREKQLAMAVGALLALLAVYWMFGKVRKSFTDRYAMIEVKEGEIREKTKLEVRGKTAAKQLAHWQHRSLPSDQELARTLYQNWLVELADKHKLENPTISAGRNAGMHKKIYYKLPFSVQCKGSLDRMVAFLHDFYGANHLHQLRDLSIKPGNSNRGLDLTFTIEALVLPGADRKDELNDESGDRLVHATLAAYKDAIVTRNLFAEYSPPPPPKVEVAKAPDPPKPVAFDPAKFAVLTGILEDGAESQVWIQVRTSGEMLKLKRGEKLKVGTFEATIARIDAAGVELESDGKRRTLGLGKALPEAVEGGATAAYYDEPPTGR